MKAAILWPPSFTAATRVESMGGSVWGDVLRVRGLGWVGVTFSVVSDTSGGVLRLCESTWIWFGGATS